MTQPASQRAYRPGPGAALVGCAGLLVTFAVLSYSAVLTKSATWDEPEHLLGSFLHTHERDFRVNPEDPALFGWIASLPLGRSAIKVDTTRELWKGIPGNTALQWQYIIDTLYRTGGNDSERALRAARAACLAVGVLLGALVAWWGYRLAGTVAAIAAAALFALDPNFLGHAALVKNDVMFSGALCALMYSMWRFGRRGTWLRFACVALFTGAALTVKYSGVLTVPILALALVTRAMLPESWQLVGFNLNTRLRRLAGAAASGLVIGFVGWGMIWGVYFFRFSPTPDPRVRLNMDRVVLDAKVNQYLGERAYIEERGGVPPVETEPMTIEKLHARQPSRIVRFALWLEANELLPQAWLYGFVYTYKSTLIRSTYLMGEYRITGRASFFPLAMLFKTPVATLVAATLALFAAVLWKFDPRPPGVPRFRAVDRWAFACLLIAPAVYGFSAVTTNLNLGLRHILPVYPFIFIASGVVTSVLWDRWAWVCKGIAAVLALGLMFESLRAWPDYIAFFNTPAGGSRGGIRLLGDSNLDWGQDLKLLADWQKRNPDKKLYLAYFGIADPRAYGIKAICVPVPSGWTGPGEPVSDPPPPGVIAISATTLQGIYFRDADPALWQQIQQFRDRQPLEVLGGTLYLYPIPLPPITEESRPPTP